MPVKRRFPKFRASQNAAAWDMLFTSGRDYFHDLKAQGYNGEAEALAAAPDAWRALGAAFLESWRPSEARHTPWALETFGAP